MDTILAELSMPFQDAFAGCLHSIDTVYNKAIGLLSDADYLAACLNEMRMEPALAEDIPELLRGSLPTSPADC